MRAYGSLGWRCLAGAFRESARTPAPQTSMHIAWQAAPWSLPASKAADLQRVGTWGPNLRLKGLEEGEGAGAIQRFMEGEVGPSAETRALSFQKSSSNLHSGWGVL